VAKQTESITRSVGRDIMKSRGLVRKRKKIDRNPRVKGRAKYDKAVKKRNQRVKEFKEGPQPIYGGEKAGIRMNVIKSTKL